MKLLQLSSAPKLKSDGSLDVTPAALPPLTLTTDSALSRDGKPVFLPEISNRWQCQVSVAYRIGRLGKSIGRRFAARYYDATTLIARLAPLDLEAALGKRGLGCSPWAAAFDQAASIGRWVEPTKNLTVEITEPVESRVATTAQPIDEAIELVSRSFILKTGDIIVADAPIARFNVNIDDKVVIWAVDSSQARTAAPDSAILTFKIK